MRPIDEIIVHCTATRPGWMEGRTTEAKVAEVRRWHREDRGWRDIGYHYLIDRNGYIVAGRALDQAGAHTKGRNANSIGVALIGGHGAAATDKFEDHFTPEQDKALRGLIEDLRRRFDVNVSGHNDYAAKGCPGFNVRLWHGERLSWWQRLVGAKK